MKRHNLVRLLALTWLVLFAGAFIVLRLTEPVGDGFTRGLNRLGVFFEWQAGAFIAAVISFVLSRKLGKDTYRRERRIGAAPLVISAALFLGFVALYAGLIFIGGK